MAPGEVHCWRAVLDLAPGAAARLYATLSPEERARSARFRFARDRARFIAAHGALREILGRYLRVAPERIGYVRNAFGKPALGPEFGGRLRFNLSHSAGLALIAVAAGCDVGVDVEYLRPQPDYAEVARRFFSAAELERLAGVPGERYAEAFLGCWTEKEARLKARGHGLAGLEGAARAPFRRGSLHALRPAPGYIGALAVAGTGRRVRYFFADGAGAAAGCGA